jgi:hypothetical protein
VSAFFESFLQADPVVRVLGGLAVIRGFGGPVWTWIRSGLSGEDRQFRALISNQDILEAESCRGSFARAFLPYVGAGSGQLPLPPETIIRSVHDSLGRASQEIVDRVRLWSYAPLLLGLVGTAWSLRNLLSRQITPATLPTLTVDMSNALLGTILGVSGALIGVVLQRVFVRGVVRTRARAETYLFDVFGRTLPEVRIKVQFDEQILETLNTRTAAIVESYREALEPMATSLADSAEQSVAAAQTAQSAFAAVAEAVQHAKELTAASEHLVNASAFAAKTSKVLEAQVSRIAETAAVNTESATAVRQSITTLENAAKELTATATELRSVVGSTLASVNDSAAAMKEVYSVSTARLVSELEALSAQSKSSSGYVADLGKEMGALREAVSSFGDARVEEIAKELKRNIEHIQKTLSDSLASIPGGIVQEMARLELSTSRTSGDVENLLAVLRQVEGSLQRSIEAAHNLATAAFSLPPMPVPVTGLLDPPRETDGVERAVLSLRGAVDGMTDIQQRTLAVLQDRLPRRSERRWLPWKRRDSRG